MWALFTPDDTGISLKGDQAALSTKPSLNYCIAVLVNSRLGATQLFGCKTIYVNKTVLLAVTTYSAGELKINYRF
jgi:hypothetical protein